MKLFHVGTGRATCCRPHLFSCEMVNDAIANTHTKVFFFYSRYRRCRRRRSFRMEPVLNWCQFTPLYHKLCAHFQWAFRMWVQIILFIYHSLSHCIALLCYITACDHIFCHMCFDSIRLSIKIIHIVMVMRTEDVIFCYTILFFSVHVIECICSNLSECCNVGKGKCESKSKSHDLINCSIVFIL